MVSAWASVKGNNTYGVKIDEDSTCLLGTGEINKDSTACWEVHGECMAISEGEQYLHCYNRRGQLLGIKEMLWRCIWGEWERHQWC